MDIQAVGRRVVDVVIVGAGFGGLYAIHRLRGMGLSVLALEAGSDIGGTWFWNRYPGARCDVSSIEYSYSFSDALVNEWTWTERFAAQPEILDYINFVADKFRLRDNVVLNRTVTSMDFDSGSNSWTVNTDKGDSIRARYCILATGPLSKPQKPVIPGTEEFAGQCYHTGDWPHHPVDFSGLQVGVIGTGSSGIQAIPQIAQQAEHLYVFQRTPNFSAPARNRPLSADDIRRARETFAEVRAYAKRTKMGIGLYATTAWSALELNESERQEVLEAFWEKGGLEFLRAFPDLLINAKANDVAAEFVREKIRHVVNDRDVADLLAPTDHYIGAKRLCSDTSYFETFNRTNVTLVDIRKHPIESITPQGLRTSEREFALDAIVFATGYDALTGAIDAIKITTDGKDSVRARWTRGPTTYLGMMVSGFPNLFILAGPGSPSILGNVIVILEYQVEWIRDLLTRMLGQRLTRVEPEASAEEEWVNTVRQAAERTLRADAKSWYTGANIPGKPRVFLPYSGGFDAYIQKCDSVAKDNYAGFVLA